MVGIKRFKIFLGIFIPFLAIFLMSQNTFATSVATSSFDLDSYDSDNVYRWTNGILYNQQISVRSVRKYQFTTASITPTGNYASIHFETNIVANAFTQQYINFVNLSYMRVLGCSSSLGGGLNINASALSYYVTTWTNGNVPSKTLTVYGDISLGGLQQQSQQIVCAVGSSEYNFFTSDLYNSANMYFEQNPMSILFTNNASDAYLQTQIDQNNTIINLNQDILNAQNQNTDDIIENQNDNTQDIIDNQTQNTQDIIKSNQNCHQSVNLFNKNSTLTNGYFTNTGSINTVSGWKVTDFISINPNTAYSTSGMLSGSGVNPSRCYYDQNKNLISCVKHNNSNPFANISPSNAYYLRESFQSNDLDNIQIQSGTATDYEPYGQEICKNINEEYYDQQRQADQNISNQSSSDIDGATNAQTTSLINVITGFIGAFSNINSTNCNITLQFPNFAGGTKTVDICSGKEKAPRIIEIGSSLLLICVFVPLAYVVIRMIYNEIRSWTNG